MEEYCFPKISKKCNWRKLLLVCLVVSHTNPFLNAFSETMETQGGDAEIEWPADKL